MSEGRILLIFDETELMGYLKQVLEKRGYEIEAEINFYKGIESIKKENFELVIVKSEMQNISAVEMAKEINRQNSEIPIIIFTEKPILGIMQELRRYGVYDYITRPVNLENLYFVVQKTIDLHRNLSLQKKMIKGLEEKNISLFKQNILLTKRIEESTKNLTRLYEDLKETYLRTIKALAQAIDARDHYTHSHSENVKKYALAIAEEMNLSPREIEVIREACELHDLGKIGIPDSILTKPGLLTQEEREFIKSHSLKAAQILEPLAFLEDVIALVREHHERYDGKGYPHGKQGRDILLGAKIIALADAYDAMTSSRSYREIPLSKQKAIEEIKRNSGLQFDPKVVEVFLKVVDKL